MRYFNLNKKNNSSNSKEYNYQCKFFGWRFNVKTLFTGFLAVFGYVGTHVANIAVAASAIVVIGNVNLPINHLSKDQIAAIYLSKPIALPGGLSLHAYDQDPSFPAYRAFYREIFDWSPDNVEGYWSSQEFSGDTSEPTQLQGPGQVIAVVEQDPHAIGYLLNSTYQKVIGRIKVKVLYGASSSQGAGNTNHSSAPHQRTAAKSHPKSHAVANNHHSNIQSQPTSHHNSVVHKKNKTSATQALAALPNPVQQKAAAIHSDAKKASQTTEKQSGAHSATVRKNKTQQSIWPVIQQHIDLNAKATERPAVRREVLWFLNHRGTLDAMLHNATKYIYYVYQETQKRHMPTMFTLLPMVESSYDPDAYSDAGAAGLWQLMPGTASSYGLDINWWYDERRDVVTSTNSALNYLVLLHHTLKSWYLTAAAYDEGEGAVEAAMARNREEGRPTDYWALPLYNEARHYVPKLLSLAIIIKHASQYHVRLPYVPMRPFFEAVKMNSQMDMAEIAKLADISQKMVEKLNPGFRRWATANGDYNLLLPVDKVQTFIDNLTKLSGKKHISWQYHEVSNNESLYSIARNYHTSVDLLRKVNGLKVNYVQPSQGILVPLWLDKAYRPPVSTVDLHQHVVTKTSTSLLPNTAKNSDGKSAGQVEHSVRVKKTNQYHTAVSSHITANDILSGKLPKLQEKQTAAASTTASDAFSSPAKNDDLPPAGNRAPIQGNDSLKTVISKIYGKGK